VDTLDQLRLLYTGAFVLWIVANIFITRVYAYAWWKSTDRDLPFILGGVWVGFTSMIETGLYALAVWTDIIPELRTWAVKLIPVFAATQAIVYIAVGVVAQRIDEPDPTDTTEQRKPIQWLREQFNATRVSVASLLRKR
jgi:hypothetical protein